MRSNFLLWYLTTIRDFRSIRTRLDECPRRSTSQTSQFTYDHTRKSKSKLQTDWAKRFTKDYVLNFYRTITLSLLSTPYGHIYFVHRICLNDFIYIYIYAETYPPHHTSRLPYVHIRIIYYYMYIFVSYIIICTLYNDRLCVK